jgi:hypothetical protein
MSFSIKPNQQQQVRPQTNFNQGMSSMNNSGSGFKAFKHSPVKGGAGTTTGVQSQSSTKHVLHFDPVSSTICVLAPTPSGYTLHLNDQRIY